MQTGGSVRRDGRTLVFGTDRRGPAAIDQGEDDVEWETTDACIRRADARTRHEDKDEDGSGRRKMGGRMGEGRKKDRDMISSNGYRLPSTEYRRLVRVPL